MRGRILERYDAKIDQLEHQADVLAGDLSTMAGPVQTACVEVLSDLMAMAGKLSNSNTPPAVRAAMRTLERLRPMMLEGIADVPADKIVEFMGDMIARLQSIIDKHEPAIVAAPEPGGEHDSDDDAAAAGGPGADRATA